MSGPDFQTFEGPTSASSPEAASLFMLRRELAKVRTTTLAQVTAVTNSGALAPIGTLTIQILVSQTDGAGNLIPAGQVFNVPYSRLAGGQNAIIMDPQVGDIGIVGFGDRDLSTVISTKAQAGPGSNRRHSWSDALWVATLPLGVTPNQYLQFNAAGITVVTPQQFQTTANQGGSGSAPVITMNSTGITLMFGSIGIQITSSGISFLGAVTGNNTATFNGEGTFNGHTVTQHQHQVTGVQTGSSTITSQKPTG